MSIQSIPSPSILLDVPKMDANIRNMQDICDRHGVALRPHIKTHKMVEAGRRQIEAGAAGLTCAKLSEAEKMLATGTRSIFIAHSLVDLEKGPRLKALADQLDSLQLAVTSAAHAEALNRLLASVSLKVEVIMAVDSGLGREGSRSLEEARAAMAIIRKSPYMSLRGIYTHEGHFYGKEVEAVSPDVHSLYQFLVETRDALDPSLELWPGCSVTAAEMATMPEIDCVRPGAYLFGDLALAYNQRAIEWDQVAITVLTTVIDKPTPELALIDAGTKVFSSDKTKQGWHALARDRRDLTVVRCNEEHGYVTGSDVRTLNIGDRIEWIPAHICTVINLTDQVIARDGEQIIGNWKVDARGCTY
jgi:D-serine deaminase-like pyridoxal phosphate-dependent protein